MTLLELMFALAVCVILATVAVSSYGIVVRRMQVSRAVADIGDIQLAIKRFELNNGALPDSLADIGMGARQDPWGIPYQYLNFATATGTGAAKVRKDHNLHPINTDFDLFSMGPDRDSRAALTARPSRDDIVRANDGRFIGLAEDY